MLLASAVKRRLLPHSSHSFCSTPVSQRSTAEFVICAVQLQACTAGTPQGSESLEVEPGGAPGRSRHPHNSPPACVKWYVQQVPGSGARTASTGQIAEALRCNCKPASMGGETCSCTVEVLAGCPHEQEQPRGALHAEGSNSARCLLGFMMRPAAWHSQSV